MEESPHECTEALTGKLHELLTDSDNDAGPFPFEEKTIEEVMQEFYKEIIACPKPPFQTPLSSPPLSEHSPSYFPNAKVELEMPAAAETENGSQLVVEHPDAGSSDEFVGLKAGQENEMERHDEDEGDFEFDEEWMARVLSCAQGQVVDSSDQWF